MRWPESMSYQTLSWHGNWLTFWDPGRHHFWPEIDITQWNTIVMIMWSWKILFMTLSCFRASRIYKSKFDEIVGNKINVCNEAKNELMLIELCRLIFYPDLQKITPQRMQSWSNRHKWHENGSFTVEHLKLVRSQFKTIKTSMSTTDWNEL